MIGSVWRGARAFVQGFRQGIVEHRRRQDLAVEAARADEEDRAEREALRLVAERASGVPTYEEIMALPEGPRAPGFCHVNGEARLASTVSPLRPADAILLARGQAPETCGSCRFFDRPMGECRRYAPTHEDDGSGEHTNATAVWPEVDDTEWCGDHVPAFQPTRH